MDKPLTASSRRVLLTEQPPPEAVLPKVRAFLRVCVLVVGRMKAG